MRVFGTQLDSVRRALQGYPTLDELMDEVYEEREAVSTALEPQRVREIAQERARALDLSAAGIPEEQAKRLADQVAEALAGEMLEELGLVDIYAPTREPEEDADEHWHEQGTIVRRRGGGIYGAPAPEAQPEPEPRLVQRPEREAPSSAASAARADHTSDRTKAIMQIVISVVALVLGVFLILTDDGDMQAAAAAWVGGVVGYWLR